MKIFYPTSPGFEIKKKKKKIKGKFVSVESFCHRFTWNMFYPRLFHILFCAAVPLCMCVLSYCCCVFFGFCYALCLIFHLLLKTSYCPTQLQNVLFQQFSLSSCNKAIANSRHSKSTIFTSISVLILFYSFFG